MRDNGYADSVAVVGMAGVFPGAFDLGTFWNNLIGKKPAVGKVPADRWIVPPDAITEPGHTPDKAYSKRACLISGFEFDPKGLDLDGIAPDDLDPLYHVALHAGREAIAACALPDRERTGVVLAAIALPTDTSSRIAREILGAAFEEKLSGKPVKTDFPKSRYIGAKVTSLPGALLAKGLGLGGGSLTLDAACASSIYAVKLARDELLSGRADAMLAGGVSRPDCLYTQVGFSQLRALSPSGICAPFDESADGLVVGEGSGILVLKRLADAMRDGDEIIAVIRGIGLSNDMRGNLLAPDPKGQVRAMRGAYAGTDLSPADIDLIECHGAGTKVGDAAELTAMRDLWGASGWTPGQCPIGSVKSHVGHLLTGAGAAGMIKTLLGLKHKIFPPSLNFKKAPPNSPLHGGPFRVQTEPEDWTRKNGEQRRAAVSAFGFGGINGHVLFEEYREHHTPPKGASDIVLSAPAAPIAIVGMEAVFGTAGSLRNFQETVFNGEPAMRKRPPLRWKGADTIGDGILGNRAQYGGFMDELEILAGEFRIPPNEIPDILPQHLLMLKVSKSALGDAGIGTFSEERPRFSVLVGIDFDYEATNFNVRWDIYNLAGRLKGETAAEWLESLRDECGPALTPVRTLGALGGLVASRIAREFRFGGPSFVVSGETASGMRALEIGVRSLRQGEIDLALAGAVDLAGDIRNLAIADAIRPYSPSGVIRPFDIAADGPVPGEGAAAVVLKRLEDAVRDGDRIYAVVRGVGNAGGPAGTGLFPNREIYARSLERAFDNADVSPDSVSYIETHGNGDPKEDALELDALAGIFEKSKAPVAMGSVKSVIGHTGAASGIASVVKTALCLYQEIVPPLNLETPVIEDRISGIFHFPKFPQYWARNRKDGPRRAVSCAMTSDGNCSHVVLEGYETNSDQCDIERKRPLGLNSTGLFTIEGDSPDELIRKLESLERRAKTVSGNIETAAMAWFRENRPDSENRLAVSILADDVNHLLKGVADAKTAVSGGARKRPVGAENVWYAPEPAGRLGETAFVFPGSGNHYVGMGRGIGATWPEILRKSDFETEELKTQLVQDCYVPQRASWRPGWEAEAYSKSISDPLHMIFGQVVYGGMMSDLARSFGVKPDAVIGYSLGESAGLFALGVWPERGSMLGRMRGTELFGAELSGPCRAVRKAWNIPPETDIDWRVAVVNRPAGAVREAVRDLPHARLLIVNTPDESVIGGLKGDVEKAIRKLGCEAVFLDGVVSVHCDAAEPVADAYKALHLFPVTPPEGVRFYSCALGRSHKPTTESAADSILRQALHGFDFPALVEQAYSDGIRVFLEMGPQSSCARMIGKILGDRPHLAISACAKGEDDFRTVLKFLGALIAERVPVDLGRLYEENAYCQDRTDASEQNSGIKIIIGGEPPRPRWPKPDRIKPEPTPVSVSKPVPRAQPVYAPNSPQDLIGQMTEAMVATSDAHRMFIDFSNDLVKSQGETFAAQTRLIQRLSECIGISSAGLGNDAGDPELSHTKEEASIRELAFDRDMCMEFAIGSIGKVLGPDFDIIDTYPVRVRLPDEPLMLADRIISVEGEKRSLGSGRVVTEHDVLPGAWYLDGDRAPVCISVEAGQADLFLCSYLGIDHEVKGKRMYRLLDATVKFHRGLPRPGDVIRYDIRIDKFVRQGETYLFFFGFDGYIRDERLITMRGGCAGFFNHEEIENSGGIILTEDETGPAEGKSDFAELVPMRPESYDETAVEALRHGDLEACFGPEFSGILPADSIRLPGGRMRLIDRVLELDPAGGRYGLGMIRARADIHPDDWFLTCHFKDDMVMPGTLMYECCAHTLRVFLQRMGWVSEKPGICYEPKIGVDSVLRCRGPVTPETKHVVYEVQISEIGYGPEPFVVADAHMYADGRYIVMFRNMTMKMTGATRQEIESFWADRRGLRPAGGIPAGEPRTPVGESRTPAGGPCTPTGKPCTPAGHRVYDRDRILEFAIGKPSLGFGEPYKMFDSERRIARLPGPPFMFIDRIFKIEPEPWVLKPGGWIEAEYTVSPDDWYFAADRTGVMPYVVLLEIALQPCGWLAAYLGSALRSDDDLKFRNLGGTATQYRNVYPDSGLITVRVRMTQASEAGNMIIEYFDMEVSNNGEMVYRGDTYFGFFTKEALAQQVGIRDAKDRIFIPDDNGRSSGGHVFPKTGPLTPNDPGNGFAAGLSMPSGALLMIDEIETHLPTGGPFGLGFLRGVKRVDPTDWFFKAHFYQDPVIPGSLGIESFIQLLKFAAMERWDGPGANLRFEPVIGKPHKWTYRGQVIPANKIVEVEAVITEIIDEPVPTIMATGFLKVDGLYVYEMEDYGIRLIAWENHK